MLTRNDLPNLYAARARAAALEDALDRLIADIEVTLDGYPSPVLIDFTDASVTDISVLGGSAVFHVSGAVCRG